MSCTPETTSSMSEPVRRSRHRCGHPWSTGAGRRQRSERDRHRPRTTLQRMLCRHRSSCCCPMARLSLTPDTLTAQQRSSIMTMDGQRHVARFVPIDTEHRRVRSPRHTGRTDAGALPCTLAHAATSARTVVGARLQPMKELSDKSSQRPTAINATNTTTSARYNHIWAGESGTPAF